MGAEKAQLSVWEVGPARGNASQLATGPPRAPRPCLACKQMRLEQGLPSVLKGKRWAPVPEMAIMLDDRRPDSGSSPQ